MEFTHAGKRIRTFAITPRTLEPAEYWKNIDDVGRWCSEYEFTGPLLFTGNDTFMEPWVCAQTVIDRYGVSPLVAVNPVYMHPFTVAKMISSCAYAFRRQIFLNLVTGTSLSQHVALDDTLDHDEKYDRLLEYTQIIQALIEKSPGPISFEGAYYRVDKLALVPPVEEDLKPGYFVAGHSDKARMVKDETGAVGMQMLLPGLASEVKDSRGIHFGIVTRATDEEAWAAANERFPESERGQRILERSMKNTDSVWKKRLKFAADTLDECDNGYWLAPFRSFQADCPYLVGSHERVRDVVAALVEEGIEHIILDVPRGEQEFAEVATAFQMARDALAGSTPAEVVRS